MGLFDSIRRVVGGGDDTDDSDVTTQPDLVDTRDLDVSALRDRAESVAGEVGVLDFSLSSLDQFDDAIDAGYDEDLATSDRPGAYATDTVRFGCYLGEVLVRAYGGEWTRNPDWGVTLSGPDGTTTVAVFDVAERSITTGAVFAPVADRAAVEVGLDGGPAGADEPAGNDTGATAESDDTDEPRAAEDPDDATPAAIADDTADEPAAGDPRPDDPAADTSSDDTPAAEGPSGDGPTAGVADGDGQTTDTPADDTTAGPDPSAPDPTPSEAAEDAVGDTESLIEEAEPGDTAPAGSSGTEPETVADPDEPETTPPAAPEGSDALFEGDTDSADEPARDTSPSLFDDAAAGSGPTVDDAPSAADGPPLSEADSGAERDDGTTLDADTGDTEPTDGDTLRETYAEAAEELVSFWTEYDLDYTPESLERLDALVSEEWDDDRFDDADFGSDDSFDDRVFTSVSTELGGYFGEVLVRELDAEWSDQTATDAVVVEGADGPLAIPVFKVAGTSIRQEPVFARSYASLLSDLDGDG
ncbi:hypothetical protein [Haloarcula sediminis]|uniref:hypothetical protein n=1 Tax=Haloarcula sediminis TaxID=3111777 RepID=UPI002D792B4A|nr:hypothetical protein [Haloarcula sp. CK38]